MGHPGILGNFEAVENGICADPAGLNGAPDGHAITTRLTTPTPQNGVHPTAPPPPTTRYSDNTICFVGEK
jgi:hypothetical protein